VALTPRCPPRLWAGPLIGLRALTDDVEVPYGHYAADNMAVTVVPNRNAIMLSIAYGVAVARSASLEICTPKWKNFCPVLPCLADRGR
jgi:hypothetical protein